MDAAAVADQRHDLYVWLSKSMSYRVVAICLLSVPFTHVAGLNLRQQGSSARNRAVHGGNRHVLLASLSYVSEGQARLRGSAVGLSTSTSSPHKRSMRLSATLMRACMPHRPSPALRLPSASPTRVQLLWSFAALTILPVALDMLPVQYSLAKEFPRIPHTHVDVVSGAAAAVAFIGELFMIKAMLVYDDKRGPKEQQSRLDKVRRTQRPKRMQLLVAWRTTCFLAATGALGGLTGCVHVMRAASVSWPASCSTGPCWPQQWWLCWGCCCLSPASCCSWHWNTCQTHPQGRWPRTHHYVVCHLQLAIKP